MAQSKYVDLYFKGGLLLSDVKSLAMRWREIYYCNPPPINFLGNKTVDQRLGANSKKQFFAKFYSKFATFLCFFSFLEQKTLKMMISTSVCSVQHLNAGQNIQQ